MLGHPIAVAGWWALLPIAALSPASFAAWGGISILACLLLAIRKRDLQHAAVSVFSWHYAAVATLIGLFTRTVPVPSPIRARVLVDNPCPPTGAA